MSKHTIALVFDFDDTLVPDSTTMLLKSRGVDPEDFWIHRLKPLIQDGWDPVHGYLKLLLDLTERGQPLEGLTLKDLNQFGQTLDPYPGLPQFFSEVKKLIVEASSMADVGVEFYIISGGLEDIIRGCRKISRHMTGIWGCRLASAKKGGPVRFIKRTISFTEKTRYLFEINKGLQQSKTDKNPMLVNKHVPEEKRRIPFRNMIYVGDGLTDIPCFSLVSKNNGLSFGILQRDEHGAAKREIFDDLLRDKRVTSMHSPRYGKMDDLGTMLRTAVARICTDISVKDNLALGF